MSTAVLEERPMVATVSKVRRQKRPLPEFVSEDYPLFGAQIGTRALMKPERMPDVKQWLVQACLDAPKLSWPQLWTTCRKGNRNWFTNFWSTRLYDRSRDLAPGDYIFEALEDFNAIPGNPPDGVEERYIAAYLELAGKVPNFAYLDLVWEKLSTGAYQMLTPKRLQRQWAAQQAEAQGFVNDWLLYYRTRRFCRQRLEEMLFVGFSAANLCMIPLKPALRAMVRQSVRIQAYFRDERLAQVEVSDDASPLDLLAAVLTPARKMKEQRLVTYDPVIVFKDMSVRPQDFGGIPLGLVAHWD